MPLSYQGVNKYIKILRKELRLNNFNTQSFRKTWARELFFLNDKNIFLIMKLLNQRTVSKTYEYINIIPDKIEFDKNITF